MKYLLDRAAVQQRVNEAEIAWKDSILGMTVRGLWNFSWWLGGRIADNHRTMMIQGKAALYAGVYISACDEAYDKLGLGKKDKPEVTTTEDAAKLQKAVQTIKLFKNLIPVIEDIESAYEREKPAAQHAEAPAQGQKPAEAPAEAQKPADAPAKTSVRLSRETLNGLVKQHPYMQSAKKVASIERKLAQVEQQLLANPQSVPLTQQKQDLTEMLDEARQKAKEVKQAFIDARDKEVEKLKASSATNENTGAQAQPAAQNDQEAQAQPASMAQLLAQYTSVSMKLGHDGIAAVMALRDNDRFTDDDRLQDFVDMFDELPYPEHDDTKQPEQPAQANENAAPTQEPAQPAQPAQDDDDDRMLTAEMIMDIVTKHNGGTAGAYVALLSDLANHAIDTISGVVDDMWETNDDTRVPEGMDFPDGYHQQLVLEGGGDYSKSFKTFLGMGVLQRMLKKYPKTDEFKKLATSLVNVKRLKRYQYEASIYYSMEGTKQEFEHTLSEDNKRVINPNLKIVWDRLMLRLDDFFQFYIDVDAINAKVKVVLLDQKTLSASQADAALYLEAKKAGINELIRKAVGYDGTTVYGFGVRNDYGSGYAIMRKVKDSRHMAVQFHWYKMFGVYEFGDDNAMKRSDMLGRAVSEACKADGFVYVAFSTTSTQAGKKPAYFYDKKGRMLMKQPYNMTDSAVQRALADAKNTNHTTSDAFRSQVASSFIGAHWRQVGVTLRGIVDSAQVPTLYRLDLSKDVYKQDGGINNAKDNHTKLVKAFQSLSAPANPNANGGDDDDDAEDLDSTAANESLDQGPNDEQQIMARDYESKIKEFGLRKGQLDQVMAKPPQDWEKLAEPIIGDNLYLGMAWRIAKLTRSLANTKEQLPTKQGEAVDRAQDDIRATEKELRQLAEDMKKHISDDKAKMDTAA